MRRNSVMTTTALSWLIVRLLERWLWDLAIEFISGLREVRLFGASITPFSQCLNNGITSAISPLK